MANLFQGLSSFDGSIGNWDVARVTTMSDMFNGASSFNQDISSWNVAKVTNMNNMFYDASSFNQDISSWDLTSLTTMTSMFYGAASFPSLSNSNIREFVSDKHNGYPPKMLMNNDSSPNSVRMEKY